MAEMTRLEAYKVLERMWSETFSAEEAEALHIAQQDIEFVDLMPNDVVPVVRCKDCKHWEDGWLGCCTKLHAVIPYDGFCSYGERRVE